MLGLGKVPLAGLHREGDGRKVRYCKFRCIILAILSSKILSTAIIKINYPRDR
jgi:hypothetical protein